MRRRPRRWKRKRRRSYEITGLYGTFTTRLAPGQRRILSILEEAGSETFFTLLCEVCSADCHEGDPLPTGERAPAQLVNEICRLIDNGFIVLEDCDDSISHRVALSKAAGEVRWDEAHHMFTVTVESSSAKSLEVVITKAGLKAFRQAGKAKSL